MKCKDCKFWVYTGNGEGECHLKAPTIQVVSIGVKTVWPETIDEEFCGEWEKSG